MSVIIPNMNIPMSCPACPLAREMFGCLVCVGFFKDNLIGRRVYESDLEESDTDFNRPDWCPLVPLPEGHGRLVDEDEIKTRMTRKMYACEHNSVDELTYAVCIDIVDHADTIVPAEGGGEDG